MTREHPVPLLQQFLLAVYRAIEAPVRMRSEFFVSLVEAVDRKEECIGIAGMEHDRDTEGRRLLVQRTQPLVVDPHLTAIRGHDGKTEVLPDLEADAAALHAPLQPVDSLCDEIGAMYTGPVHPRDRGEAGRGSPMKSFHHFECIRPCAHR